MKAHQGSVFLCDYRPNEGQMLAIGGGHKVWLIDVRTGALRRVEQRSGRVRCIALSADGVLIDGGFDKKVTLQQTSSGASLYAYPQEGVDGQEVRSVAISRDGALLAIGYEDHQKGVLELYDTRHNKCLLTRTDAKAVWAVAISPDGKLMLTRMLSEH